EEESLEPGAPSLLAALAAEGDRFGIAAIDFATGAFRATEVRGWELARDELERLAPRELLLASDLPPPVDAACREGRPWAAAVLPEPVPLEGDLPRLAARAAGGALAYVDDAYRRRPARGGARGRGPRRGGRGGRGARRRAGGAARHTRRRARPAPRGRRRDRRHAGRGAAAPHAPPRLHPPRVRPGSGRAARDGVRRQGLARALRDRGARAHAHRLPQGAPQQGVRLLRRGDAREPAARPARLRAPA